MASYKIEYDKEECIGCGVCNSQCPENWDMVDTSEGSKAKPKKTIISEDEYNSNSEAADMCPVDAIKIDTLKERKRMGAEAQEDDVLDV
tara:strand:+ start:114 stop:380 length:267 start_codon:yes stop_codon:yes gene_type:complete